MSHWDARQEWFDKLDGLEPDCLNCGMENVLENYHHSGIAQKSTYIEMPSVHENCVS